MKYLLAILFVIVVLNRGDCKVVNSCKIDGFSYKQGEYVVHECNGCRCNNGIFGCTKMFCINSHINCVSGSTTYHSGDHFQRSCNICQCWNGRISCTNRRC
ncbi:hypothetical protein SNEBB_010919 [Seison nebaliae]|nr:hypothetical protein SNEBB_010919 [Seison nebaliae]